MAVFEAPAVVVVTGIMASGKSTVAEALARRLPLAAHVRGDGFRRAIVTGRAPMTDPLSARARAQLDLRQRLAATVADAYVAAGITAVVQDLYLGRDLGAFVGRLSSRAVYVVVLAPRAEVVLRREQARTKTGYDGWSVDDFDHELRTRTPRLGMWIDTSELTVAQTVEAVLAEPERARRRPDPG